MSDTDTETTAPTTTPRTGPLPEFRIVVKHPNKRGPLGPYRLTLSVAFALLVAGGRMWTSVTSAAADEMILLEAAGAGLFAWILTTMISNLLGSVPPDRSNPQANSHSAA